MYYTVVDEIQSKILVKRAEQFDFFDEISCSCTTTSWRIAPELTLCETPPSSMCFLHYMYCTCDIGKKK